MQTNMKMEMWILEQMKIPIANLKIRFNWNDVKLLG